MKPASLLLLLLALGCTSAPPARTGPITHPLEQNAINVLARGNHEDAASALDAALKHYERTDNLAGQWRITRMQANLALSKGDTATTYADNLAFLASYLSPETTGYDTELILGRSHPDADDAAHYRNALSLARTPLERAVALTYLGRGDEAVNTIAKGGNDHPGDRAFVFYSTAVLSGNPDYFNRALRYYQLAGDSRGISDALIRLAQNAVSRGEVDAAKGFARRAINTLRAAGETAKAEATSTWLQTL